VISHPRIGVGDLTDHILSAKTPGLRWPDEFVHLMIPMEFDEDRARTTPIGWSDPRSRHGELAWPERFSAAQCDSLKAAVGFVEWNCRWQQTGWIRADR